VDCSGLNCRIEHRAHPCAPIIGYSRNLKKQTKKKLLHFIVILNIVTKGFMKHNSNNTFTFPKLYKSKNVNTVNL